MERKQADRPKPLLDLLLSGETMHPDQFKPDPQKIAFWGQVPMADSEAADCSEAAIEELRRTWVEEGVPYQPDQILVFGGGQSQEWEGAPVTLDMWEIINPRHIQRVDFVPVHIARANGENYDLCRWPQEYADKLEAARKTMHEILLLPEEETSMQSLIAQASDANGVKREDLCLYLMCLGLMRG